MRINSYISSTGYCSRRAADQLVADKKVTINGEIATMGQQVLEGDVVLVEGKPLKEVDSQVYIALNKPRGITCTTEQHIQGNIIDFVNHPQRIFPIGRLDKDSQGLILLTSDGSIVNKILTSENDHEKEYIVLVNKKITDEFIRGLSVGVKIYNPVKNEYTTTNPSKVKQLGDKTFSIILTQGLNRQIRRMCSKLGYTVKVLKRVRVLNIKLGNLKVGEWRDLSQEELNQLFKLISKN